MVVPALGAAYLLARPPRCSSRIRQLLVAGVVMVAVSCAWPLAVTLWPGAKPYIGGSTDGTVWDLILGYNGFGRIFGEGGAWAAAAAAFGGAAGLWRMFNAQVGGQIAWLLPLALSLGSRAVADAPRAAHRPAPRRPRPLRRLGARPRRGLLQPAGHLPPVLRERAGARGGGAGRRLGAGAARVGSRRCWRASPAPPGSRSSCSAARRTSRRGWAWRSRSPRRRRRRAALPAAAPLAVAAVAGAFAVGAGPASYAVANLGHALNGNNVLAGPSSVAGRLRRRPGRRRCGGSRRPAAGRRRRRRAPAAPASAGGRPRRRRASAAAPVSGEMLALPREQPGLGEVPRRRDRLAGDRADHHRDRQGRRHDGRLQRPDNAPTVSQLRADGRRGRAQVRRSAGAATAATREWVQAHGTAVDGYENLYERDV